MPIDRDTLGNVAARMLDDYDKVTPGTLFAEGLRLDVDEAWQVQTAVTGLREARGERVIGYKVGCTTKDNQRRMGVAHPVWGRLWDTELHDNGATLDLSRYDNLSIEAEFGVVLARDLRPGMSIEAIADAVETVHPLLELHNLRMRGEQPRGPELIANNCINCGVVRGAPVPGPGSSANTDLQLVYDGKVVDEWPTLRWPDDILDAVDALVSRLSDHGLGLTAGNLVLTGAWGPPIPVDGHKRVDVTSCLFGNAWATIR